jgi:Fur family peroxide stress response transcriptional regulator
MRRNIPFEDFQTLCRECGLIATHQRYLTYRTIVSLDGNPTPEEVFEAVRKNIPSISLATVYKNIDTLVDHGMLRDVSPNYGSRRVDSTFRPHDHFVCRVCRKVIDLGKHIELQPPARADLPMGTKFEYYMVEAIGICSACASQRRDRPRH